MKQRLSNHIRSSESQRLDILSVKLSVRGRLVGHVVAVLIHTKLNLLQIAVSRMIKKIHVLRKP